ncbi:unnamed protein product [Caenorhabditis auriculariae]|uniref:Uncharacterized protein n=1 Tax=Caenorhabditis auriculariae TaxID=2777116 RepID=A0A8S1H765_9PELO|nr:unnamed protein product [Caenorhabditis auriculariae]
MLLEVVLLFGLIPRLEAFFGLGRTQSVAVSGRLICDGHPASNVKIKLYDVDNILDTLLEESTTDQNGQFRVSGNKNEITDIDPKLNIYHKCDYNGLCYKKVEINIPDDFITDGSNPAKTFDIGTINLANQFSGDSTDCLN